LGNEVHAISQVFTGGIYDVLADLCEPLLSRIRRLIPSMVAGLDLSFLWAIIALQALIILISGLRV